MTNSSQKRESYLPKDSLRYFETIGLERTVGIQKNI